MIYTIYTIEKGKLTLTAQEWLDLSAQSKLTLHRTDGPAIEFPGGRKEWYLDGKRHREDGPAVEDGDKIWEWYLQGNLHRTDGPAAEYANGSKEWYLNDRLHRTDGPAIEYADGTKEWYIGGYQLSEELHNLFIRLLTHYPPELRLTDPEEWIRSSLVLTEK